MSRRAERRAPLHAVILAGGAGERFWPASRRSHPKPFLQVVGGRSLLDATLARARRFAPPERIWIVCGHEHARAVRRAAQLPRGHVLVEPARRNTALAVAWASQCIEAREPGAVVAVLPADHHIPDGRALARDIRVAARAAADQDVLVALGVRPTRPDTGYGYVRLGGAASGSHARLRRVSRFVEKPDAGRARRYLRDGRYLWNAGVFVWRAARLLEEVEVCCPPLHRAMAPFRRTRGAARRRANVEKVYRRAPALAVDVAVMERSRRVWTLPVDFAWSDVGTWASLAEELGVGTRRRAGSGKRPEAAGNRVIAGDVLCLDAADNLVWSQGRLVALLGVEGLAVVDTGDVILVTRLDRSSDVRHLVGLAKARGREGLT